ncbi:Nif3-like dinuclear metal center hexameric protein [Mycoplasma sp. U97]|uniref:Nif3-like dinuclear metal center hexameric protein n=1 Tax=Mycoplasma tauri TaxID=547987 RepID=UPI001CBFF85B|nr:Nif3-like dinuclear metal center hexameric protein [Mycoplasma tauri]MBZ4212516.1 Nif3-like dinuclear metal center hexameric protein [Mycoplasma tauri]
MQIKQLTNFLFRKYPLKNKEIWDPSGWSFKNKLSDELTGVIIAIDLTSNAINEAIKSNCNLIITHHPFKFYKKWVDEEIYAPYKKEILQKLINHRINVISFHTNYDNHKNGTSYQIAKQLGFKDENINNFDWSLYPASVINLELSFTNIVELIKQKLNFSSMRTNLPKSLWNKEINKIAILSGSGFIGEVNKIKELGYDLIITSDIKWSDWINYKETKTPILEISHLDEQVFVDDIYNQLNNKFFNIPLIKVKIQNEPYENV